MCRLSSSLLTTFLQTKQKPTLNSFFLHLLPSSRMSSSDLFLFDNDSFFRHSTTTDMVSLSLDELTMPFFSDPFFPFEDSDNNNLLFSNQNQFSPSQQLNNLSLEQNQPTQLQLEQPQPLQIPDFSVLNTLGVKSEETYLGFDSFSPQNHPSFLSEKVMQRSLSSQSLDRKPGFFFQPRFDSVIEAPNFQTQVLGSSPETMCTIRRVCSTGDLQKMRGSQLGTSPLASSENCFMEEGSYKARRYSPEERKQRIHRYRSKRTQRNFNKTIKYACRKTLADSRPRVRGRFARNDETGEIPKVAGCNREEEDEDELWVDGFHEEEEEAAMVVQAGFHNFRPTQYGYHRY